MSFRTSRVLAICLLLLGLVPTTVSLVLLAQTADEPVTQSWVFRGFSTLFAVVFGAVGAVITLKRTENPIGWLFSVGGALGGVQALADEYATYALLADPPLPFGYTPLWIEDWIWVPAMSALTIFVPLLFPTGRLLSKRWRPVVWIAAVIVVHATISSALLAESVPAESRTELPFPILPQADLLFGLGILAFISMMGVAAVALILRTRRASGLERQQLKWVATAAAFVVFAFALMGVPAILGYSVKPFEALLIFSVLLVPVAAGFAILRYRLYDIDIVINRTLVYGPLSAILAGVYIASIGLFQRLFAAITGSWSEPALVFTTLIVVALFTPIRNRLQTVVDKRFKLASYDPMHDVRQMAQQVRSVLDALDRDQPARRFLGEAIKAVNAEGGAIYLRQNGILGVACVHGNWHGQQVLTVPILSRATEATEATEAGHIALGPRQDGKEYRPGDAQALGECAALIADALVWDMRPQGSARAAR